MKDLVMYGKHTVYYNLGLSLRFSAILGFNHENIFKPYTF